MPVPQTKQLLKAARDAITKKDYQSASDYAKQILQDDPSNYSANVFLGVASLEIGQTDLSEQAYLAATKSQPNQPLAWQGICKLYERTQDHQKHIDALLKLAATLNNDESSSKCLETIQKAISLTRESGSRADVIRLLSMSLPDSGFCQDALNAIADRDVLGVYEELVRLTEKEETDHISKEVSRRRQRLDGIPKPRDVVEQEVGVVVWQKSSLPALYLQIMNHPRASDELRRSSEAKLLQYQYKLLQATSLGTSIEAAVTEKLRNEIFELVNGMVLLRIPNELAWLIYLNIQNYDDIYQIGMDNLLQYTKHFPSDRTSLLLDRYFKWKVLNTSRQAAEESTAQAIPVPLDLDDITELMDDAPKQPALLHYRVLVEMFFQLEEYENTTKMANAGILLIDRWESLTGVDLSRSRASFTLRLGAALVHQHPPLHHAQAQTLLSTIRSVQPENALALVSLGYISHWSKEWKVAEDFFAQAVNDTNLELEAKEGQAWALVGAGKLQEAISDLEAILSDLPVGNPPDTHASKRNSRLHWKLGHVLWLNSDFEAAYKQFIISLKLSASNAASFTSLGIYYAANNDVTRSTKCFQKAFELDRKELFAAKTLLESFARDGAWDLVEIVARRVVDEEPTASDAKTWISGWGTDLDDRNGNLWAWKALGLVEIYRRSWSNAVHAFQLVTREDQDDCFAWIQLGEAYYKASRYEAGLKCLVRAKELEPTNWLINFLIGEIQRRTGDFAEAIETFNAGSSQTTANSQPGVLLAIADAHFAQGCEIFANGFLDGAEESFISTIQVSIDLIEHSVGLRRLGWKLAADALLQLSLSGSHVNHPDAARTLESLVTLSSAASDIHKRTFIRFPSLARPISGEQCLRSACVLYYNIYSFAHQDEQAKASAAYDVAVALVQLQGHLTDMNEQVVCREESLHFVKSSLQLNPTDWASWILLGDLYFKKDAKFCQHCYIQAVEIDHKNVDSWIRLGLLYLDNDDLDLAQRMLDNALAIDPQHPLVWFTKGLLWERQGQRKQMLPCFEYASQLAGNSPVADLHYVGCFVDKLGSTTDTDYGNTTDPSMILEKYSRRFPTDSAALHLQALLYERTRNFDKALEAAKRCSALLESLYEETEDSAIETHFAISHATIGRQCIALGRVQDGLNSFETANSLLTDTTSHETLKLQCLWCIACIQSQMQEVEEAVSTLQTASAIEETGIQHAQDHTDVLLARILWSGHDVEKAQACLLECVSAGQQHLTAIATLAAMGILTEDEALVDAALAEISSVPIDIRMSQDPGGEIPKLLSRQSLRMGDSAASLRHCQGMLHISPHNLETRVELAKQLLLQQECTSALGILRHSTLLEGNDKWMHSALILTVVIEAQSANVGSTNLQNAQNAVMKCPWEPKSWLGLAYIRSLSGEQ